VLVREYLCVLDVVVLSYRPGVAGSWDMIRTEIGLTLGAAFWVLWRCTEGCGVGCSPELCFPKLAVAEETAASRRARFGLLCL